MHSGFWQSFPASMRCHAAHSPNVWQKQAMPQITVFSAARQTLRSSARQAGQSARRDATQASYPQCPHPPSAQHTAHAWRRLLWPAPHCAHAPHVPQGSGIRGALRIARLRGIFRPARIPQRPGAAGRARKSRVPTEPPQAEQPRQRVSADGARALRRAILRKESADLSQRLLALPRKALLAKDRGGAGQGE